MKAVTTEAWENLTFVERVHGALVLLKVHIK